MNQIEKLYEWAGVEYRVLMSGNKKMAIHPNLTAEKREQLEDLILKTKSTTIKNFDPINNIYLIAINTINGYLRGKGLTIDDCIANLVIQISWTDEEMKQIKEILKG